MYQIDSVVSIQLIDIVGKPFYQIRCKSEVYNKVGFVQMKGVMNYLADATTGTLRGPLTQEEAIQIAEYRFKGEPKIKQVEYLTFTNNHHEYRENQLPAYAVTFIHPSNTTVYVSSELGTVQKYRNDKWRVFDFLWMMHTMDYQSRDNFGNILLRFFQYLGCSLYYLDLYCSLSVLNIIEKHIDKKLI